MLKHGLYNIVGGAIRLVLSLLTVPLMIRIIGVEEYGLWSLASAVIGIVALAEAGLPIATTVFVSRDLAKKNVIGLSETLTTTLGSMFILATAAAIALWVAAPWLIQVLPSLSSSQREIAIRAFQIGSIVVWARLLQQVLVGIEQAFQRYGTMNLLNTIQAVLISGGMLLIVWFGGRTLEMMAWTAIISFSVLFLHSIFSWLLLRAHKLRLAWNRKTMREVAQFSALAWLTNLGGVLFSQFDRVIVGIQLGTRDLGIYSAITAIAVQINVFSALPVQPLLPRVSSTLANGDANSSSLHRTLKKAFGVNALIALGMGAALILGAPLVVRIMMPDAYSAESVAAFQLAIAIYALYSLNAVGYYLLFAINAVKINLILNLVSGITTLALIAALSKNYGLMGAVAGNAGYLLSLLFVPVALKRLNMPLLGRLKSNVAN